MVSRMVAREYIAKKPFFETLLPVQVLGLAYYDNPLGSFFKGLFKKAVVGRHNVPFLSEFVEGIVSRSPFGRDDFNVVLGKNVQGHSRSGPRLVSFEGEGLKFVLDLNGNHEGETPGEFEELIYHLELESRDVEENIGVERNAERFGSQNVTCFTEITRGGCLYRIGTQGLEWSSVEETNMTDVMKFFEIILRPEPVMQGLLKKTDRNEAMRTFALVGAIMGLLFGIGAFLGAGFIGGGLLAGLGLIAIIVFPIIFAIMVVIGAVIGFGIITIIAGLLGGKGTFDQHFYLGSKLAIPGLIISIVTTVLGIIPLIGGLIGLIWNLYSIYLQVVLISVVGKMSKLRALVVIVIPIVIVGILIGSLLAAALVALVNPMVIGG
mgnify:CR=1 FL=1